MNNSNRNDGIDKKPKGDDISTPKKFHQKSRNLRGKKESFSRQRTTQIGNRQETNRGGDNPTQRNSTEDQETTTKSTTRTSNSSQQTGDSTQRFQISKPKRSAGILESLGRAPDSLARSHETHRERERGASRSSILVGLLVDPSKYLYGTAAATASSVSEKKNSRWDVAAAT